MISRKYITQVFSFFMAFFMSGLMSLMVSLINMGFADDILYLWLKAWSIAFVIAFPTILIISPHVQKLVELVLKDE